MNRDIDKIRDDPFDLLVIGGGIYGVWTAYDAALRGLKVALVEKGDWASGTSSASSKLIHGGLRYLEHFWFGLVRKSLTERRRLLSLGPHRIYPLNFLLPIYRSSRVGRFRMGIGLSIYDHLTKHGRQLQGHHYLKHKALLEAAPYLEDEGILGGFSYSDCQTDDARLVLELVSGAVGAGAAAVNYMEVTELISSNNRVSSLIMEDRESGKRLEVKASVIADMAGPWAGRLPGTQEKVKERSFLAKGVHLVMPSLPGSNAVLLSAKSDGRVFFLIPWYGTTMIGTTDTEYSGDPDKVSVEKEDVSYLLNAANGYLGEKAWSESEIMGSFAGLRVLPMTPGRSPSSVTREWKLVRPMDNLLVSLGGKLTSAREDSAIAVNRVMTILGKSTDGLSPTADRPLPWCPGQEVDWKAEGRADCIQAGIDEETAVWSTLRYGSTLPGLLSIIKRSPDLSGRITPDFPFCKGEIVHAAENEMALTLEDILRRRIPLTILTRLDKNSLIEAAELAGEVLGWDDERKDKEMRILI